MDVINSAGALALGSRLRRLSEQIMADGAEIYSQADIEFEPRWFPVFYYLHTEGPGAITDIARQIGLSHPAVNQIAGSMIQAGVVASYRDARDKRRRLLALTREGKAMTRTLERVWQDVTTIVDDVISETGVDVLQTLARIEASLARQGLAQRYALARSRLVKAAGIDVLPYQPEFAGDFRALNEEWIRELFEIEASDLKVLDDPAAIIDQGGEILFAVDRASKEVIGTVALIKKDDAVCELAKMAVKPAGKGRGIGRLLGEKVIETARDFGFMKMFLETNSALAPALSLYRSLGFEDKPSPFTSDYQRSDVYMDLTL